MTTLTRPEAVTLALYSLGGAKEAIDTEVVAIRAADLTPGMFSWRNYPDRIDKELVRVALSDARLKKEWVVGSHDKGGWMLTTSGQEFARSKEAELENDAIEPASRDDKRMARERMRLLASEAYARILTEGSAESVTDAEADAFFRINVYVRGQARERKIARIENQFGEDPELGQAVRLLAEIARNRETA